MDFDPSHLPQQQRLQLAGVCGAGRRYAEGNLADRPDTEAVEAVRRLSTDPVVLGHALGGALAELELTIGGSERLAGIYEAAGADPDVAAGVLDRHRDDHRRRGRL